MLARTLDYLTPQQQPSLRQQAARILGWISWSMWFVSAIGFVLFVSGPHHHRISGDLFLATLVCNLSGLVAGLLGGILGNLPAIVAIFVHLLCLLLLPAFQCA